MKEFKDDERHLGLKPKQVITWFHIARGRPRKGRVVKEHKRTVDVIDVNTGEAVRVNKRLVTDPK